MGSIFIANAIMPYINVLWIIVAIIVISALGIALARRWIAKAKER